MESTFILIKKTVFKSQVHCAQSREKFFTLLLNMKRVMNSLTEYEELSI